MVSSVSCSCEARDGDRHGGSDAVAYRVHIDPHVDGVSISYPLAKNKQRTVLENISLEIDAG